MQKSSDKGDMISASAAYRNCDPQRLNDGAYLLSLLRQAAVTTKLNPLSEQSHQFEPMGFTGILLLSESHIAIHTWPEKRLAMVDFFTCGGQDPQKALELVGEGLGSEEIEVRLATFKV